MDQDQENLKRLKNLLQNMGIGTGGSYDPQTYEQKRADQYNLMEGGLDGYSCPICKNKGFVAGVRHNSVYDYWEWVLRSCSCTTMRNSANDLKASGLPTLDRYTLDKYETKEKWQKEFLELAERYRDERGNHWFFVGGQSGAGKTHICTALCVALISSGKKCMYMDWVTEGRRLASIVMQDEDYSKAINHYKKCDVLYIDDLYKGGVTAGILRLAFELINARYFAGKTTIISSQFTLPAVEKADQAVAGRIREMCEDFVYNIADDENKNYRTQWRRK
jgi:DNA replication protein DnaC